MIQANELRIGNKFLGIAGVQTVLDISDNTDRNTLVYNSDLHKAMYSHLITVVENRNQYKPCEMDGIPLTPEILVKAGFNIAPYVGDKRNHYYHESGLFAFKGYRNSNDYYYESSLTDVNITSLHQLMNLYHALTGKELNIEL
jgi:hypothetical protein